jgi:hypothetical protein
MKQRLLLLTICLGWICSSHAGEYSVYPRMHFQLASTWVNANKTCIHDDVILHKEKDVQVFTYCNDSGGNCTEIEKPLVQPIVSTKWRCNKEDCTPEQMQPYEFTQGPHLEIKVYWSKEDAENGSTPKKVIPYTLDQCTSI